MRKDRAFDELREIAFETNINIHAEGSCLVKFGNTHVICTASIDEKTPPWSVSYTHLTLPTKA